MNYFCYRLEEQADYVEDKEIKELICNLADLLHDLEWYTSGDYGKDDYEKSLKEFKSKWFNGNRDERLRRHVEEIMDETKHELDLLLCTDDAAQGSRTSETPQGSRASDAAQGSRASERA